MSLCRLGVAECDCLMAFQSVGSHWRGLTGLGKAEAVLRSLREERRSQHSLSVYPCARQMCNHPPAFYPAVVCCEAAIKEWRRRGTMVITAAYAYRLVLRDLGSSDPDSHLGSFH
jgi:hypothetical protein